MPDLRCVLEEKERQDNIRFRVTIAVQNITKETNYRHAEACNLITFGTIGIVSMSE